MPDVSLNAAAMGVLAPGCAAGVDGYPLALGWAGGGGLLCTLSAEGALTCFDGRTAANQWRADAHPSGGLVLAVNPDGRTLVTGGQDGTAAVWATADGTRLQDFAIGGSWVTGAAWAPDGNVLALATGREVQVLNRDGAELARLPHPSTVAAIAFCGRRELASACYGRAAFWDVDDGAPREIFDWKNAFIALAVSPGAGILACGGQDGSVHFWRRESGQDSEMRGYQSNVAMLAFDASGRWLATGGDAHASIWDFSGGGPEGTAPIQLAADRQRVTVLAWSRRQPVLATGGLDGRLSLWRLGVSGSGRLMGAAELGAAVTAIAWRADDRAIAVSAANGRVAVFRVRF